MDNVKLKKELFDLIIEHAATEYLYDEADALKIKTEKVVMSNSLMVLNGK